MDWAILTSDGGQFLLRWMHFFFGVIWIGLLYYFNLVQVPFMGEADGPTKSGVVQKLVPRALWWFRWGAMATFLSGWLIIGMRAHGGIEVFRTAWGYAILTGATLGTLMWANVWFVIWPNQKIVIANAVDTAAGKPANPAAAACGARALVASRTNMMFSIPMLFFMGAASHLPLQIPMDASCGAVTAVIGIILIALEANALKGKVGPMATVRGVLTSGFVLAAVLYAAMEVLT